MDDLMRLAIWLSGLWCGWEAAFLYQQWVKSLEEDLTNR